MTKVQVLTVGSEEGVRAAYDKMGIPIGQEVLDLLAGDPPRYPHVPGDFHLGHSVHNFRFRRSLIHHRNH